MPLSRGSWPNRSEIESCSLSLSLRSKPLKTMAEYSSLVRLLHAARRVVGLAAGRSIHLRSLRFKLLKSVGCSCIFCLSRRVAGYWYIYRP